MLYLVLYPPFSICIVVNTMSQVNTQYLYILYDDKHYAALLKKIAEKSGWQTISKYSAHQFLKYDLPSKIRLVLDLLMLELDGI